MTRSNSPASADIHPDGTGKPPWPLRWLIVGVVVSIILLIGLPIAMLVDREGLEAAIIADTDQTLGSGWLDRVVVFVIVYAIVLHLVDVVLLLWLVPRILRGRPWARIVLTVYLVVATVLSLYSAPKGGMYLAVVIPTDIIHIIMLVLLWGPPSTRRFFRPDPASAPA